jgi:cytochrome P450
LSVSVLRGYNHLDFLALHDRYGPAIRVSPDELSFNTAQSFRDIYGNRLGGCFQKDRSHYISPANGVDHLLSAIDDATYTRQKRLLSHAFSDKALRDQEGLIRGYVDTLIKKLRLRVKHGESLIDIKAWLNFTTFDITGDLMFGESFDCLKDSQLHPWIQLIFGSIKALAMYGIINQFPWIKWILDLLLPAEAKRKSQEHFDLTAQKVDRRLETNMARPDFMSAILQNGLGDDNGQHCENKRTMTRAEIHSNGFMWAAFFPVNMNE